MDYAPSRYIRKTLMQDERCSAEARFSWIYTFQAWFTWFACAMAGYGVHYVVYRQVGYFTPMPLFIGSLIGFLMFLSMMMKKWTTEIILTNQRLIYKRGFFAVNVIEIDIEQLASDRVEQSIIGRIFNYGTIHIRCIEAPDLWLPAIRKPYEFRNALEKQKHEYREHYMKVERLRHHGKD